MSNKLALTRKVLEDTKSLQEMFELEPVRINAIQNYVKTSGKSEAMAAMHYEREKILFFKVASTLSKCDKFSVYSSWIELMASGSTLNEGHAYIIGYGKTAQFQMGWRGRLDQIGMIPEVINVPPAQIVRENDEFDYELGEKPRVIKHKPLLKGDRGQLTHVYLIIEKTSGYETHLMTRDQVIAIRDRYSQGYKTYVEACEKHGKKIGDTIEIPKEWEGRKYTQKIEPPMWVSDEETAWKKTLVKRAYNSQANKTARMKAIDEKIIKHVDPEDGTVKTDEINYGMDETQNVSHEVVDEGTGEVTQSTGATEKKEEKKKDESKKLSNEF